MNLCLYINLPKGGNAPRVANPPRKLTLSVNLNWLRALINGDIIPYERNEKYEKHERYNQR